MTDLPDINDLMPTLLDRMDDEVYVHTLDGRPIYANDALLSRLGLTLEAFKALPPYGWIAEMTRTEVPKRIEQVIRYGHARFESTYRTADGGVGSYEVSVSLVRKEDPPVVVGIGRDTTGRTRLIEALEFRAVLLDNVEDCVLAHTLHGGLVYTNEKCAMAHGYTQAEMRMLSLHEILAPEQEPDAETMLARLSRGERYEGVVADVRNDGSELLLEARWWTVPYGEQVLGVRMGYPVRQDQTRA